MTVSRYFAATIVVAAAGLCLSAPAHAGDFLINPVGGTDLRDSFVSPVQIGNEPPPKNTDDGLALRNIGFDFKFFGKTYSDLYVTTNGFLGFTKNASPADMPFPRNNSVPMIAGAWDDLWFSDSPVLGPDKVLETKSENYYAITYYLHKRIVGGGAEQFQIALFGAAQTIGGHAFKANDVAFTYKRMNDPSATGSNPGATIGLDAADGTHFVVPPAAAGGTTGGRFTTYKNLPYFSGTGGNGGGEGDGASTGNTLLYTPDINDNYSADIVAVSSAEAPEPVSLALFALGGLTFAGLRRKKR